MSEASAAGPRAIPLIAALLAGALVLRHLRLAASSFGLTESLLLSVHWLALGVWSAAALVKVTLARSQVEERERLAALTLADRQLALFAPVEALGLFTAGGTAALLLLLLSLHMPAQQMSHFQRFSGSASAALLAVAAGLFFLGWLSPRPGYWPKPRPGKATAFFFPEIKFAPASLALLACASLFGALSGLAAPPGWGMPARLLGWVASAAAALAFGLAAWQALVLNGASETDFSALERALLGRQAQRAARLLAALPFIALGFAFASSVCSALALHQPLEAVGPLALLTYVLLAGAALLAVKLGFRLPVSLSAASSAHPPDSQQGG